MSDYKQVFDRKENRVRGLWCRENAEGVTEYYAQMRVPGKTSAHKVKLETADRKAPSSVVEAIELMTALKSARRGGDLKIDPKVGVPKFCEVADQYVDDCAKAEHGSETTRERERICLNALKGYFGDRPINRIENHETLPPSGGYILWRKEHPLKGETISGRAIDLDIIVLRKVLQTQVGKHLRENPITKHDGRRKLGKAPKPLKLIKTSVVNKIIETARNRPWCHDPRLPILRQFVKEAEALKAERRESILRLSAEGKSQREIARELGIDRETVRSHLEAAENPERRLHTPKEIFARHPEWPKLLNWEDRKARQVAIDIMHRIRTGKYDNGGGEADQLADFLTILKHTGAREYETTQLRWSQNIDWNRGKYGMIGFGLEGESKGGERKDKSRWQPMSKEMADYLREMHARRVGASDWLFPSPRKDGDVPVLKLRRSLERVADYLKLPYRRFGFHYFRHYFISVCCMSGIDSLTCSKWVGHSDMQLIAKIYAHLNDEHSQEQITKLDFGVAR